ncbi:MAG: cytochrome c biogenesis protein CcsA [Acidimicrobiaceae bacterium]|nr:cytochrome c biogenesis protein CcsA [Acidimicrobiaceae bacterium]
MSNALLGSVFIAVGFAAALLGVGVSAVGLAGWFHRWEHAARMLAYTMTVAIVAAVIMMEKALITRDFTVKFVADNGSSTTPAVFNVATLWSALEGSILLWVLVLCGYVVAVAVRFRSRTSDTSDNSGGAAGSGQLLGWVLLVLFTVCVFFFALMVGPAAPFIEVNPPTGYDGPGPNPLLQNHILMAFHPPILYLGYVGFTVPFAFAIAALASGKLEDKWLTATRRWTLAAWGFLTSGIVLGAWWSYETLGWGGYWAWDPVENASFLPWLTGTAYLHSVVVQERRGLLRVWNLSLVIATFSLTILGTFLTRSGVLASVHSFTESGIGPAILGFFAAIVIVSLVLIVWRGGRLYTGFSSKSPTSREAAFLVNNALFAVFAFVVLLGTVFPLLVEAFDGRTIAVGTPYFDRMTRPIGFALLFLMAVAPMLPWGPSKPEKLAGQHEIKPAKQPEIHKNTRKNTRKNTDENTGENPTALNPTALLVRLLSKRLLAPMWMAVAALVVAVVVGARGWAPLSAFGLAGFAGGAALRQIVLSVRSHRWSGFFGRTNGGMVVHLGVVLIAVGLAASQSYVRQAEFELTVGQTAFFSGHELAYLGSSVVLHDNRTERVAHVRVDNAKTYDPAIALYPFASRAIGIPSVRSTLFDDVALSVMSFPGQENVFDIGGAADTTIDTAVDVGSSGGDGVDAAAIDVGSSSSDADGGVEAFSGDSVILRVTVQPLVVWLWGGGIVMALGTVLALIPARNKRLLKIGVSAADDCRINKPREGGSI